MLVQNLILALTLYCGNVQYPENRATYSPSEWDQRHTATTINNNTGYTITYAVRWGSGPWKTFTLYHGQCFCHYWTTQGNNSFIPRMEITFDSDFGSWDFYKSYALMSEHTYYPECIYGSQYSFYVSGQNIDLFKD